MMQVIRHCGITSRGGGLMNGFAEHRARGRWGAGRAKEAVLTGEAGMAMLPLVARITPDIVACQRRLPRLDRDRPRLERTRHNLSWPERARRYEIVDEIG